MKINERLLVMILFLVVTVLLSACGAEEQTAKVEPAIVEKAEGAEFNNVTLTERAAERIDIRTEPVSEQETGNGVNLVVPYSAVIYGLNGETWAYVRNPGPGSLTFVRASITVSHIEGGLAFLTDGPPAGTEVVTVGAALLYGADTGVGK